MFVAGGPSTPPLFVRPNANWYELFNYQGSGIRDQELKIDIELFSCAAIVNRKS
jgi:hypothetical protein